MKRYSFLMLLIVVILIILIGSLIFTRNVQHAEHQTMLNKPISNTLGGDFILPSTHGRPLNSTELRGEITLITFGYANCTEVCPVGLTRLHEVINGLGDTAHNVNVIFVSFDSFNDLDHLAKYLRRFDPSIIGVTGDEDQISDLTQRYGVVYPKQRQLTGDASFDHNGFIYLLDQDGRVRAIYQNLTPVKKIISEIHSLQNIE